MGISTYFIKSENILSIVNTFRSSKETACFVLNTEANPFSGKQCLVYVVGFSDGTNWAVRIPVHSIGNGADAISNSVEYEAHILRKLQDGGFQWSPRLVGYCSTFDNLIQFPYIISTWVVGSPLEWDDTTPRYRENRNKVVRQMARIMLDLARASRARGTHKTAKFLTDIIDRKITRTLKRPQSKMAVRSCFTQRAIVKEVFESSTEQTTTQIDHRDLTPHNIIVDNEYNIKGIIDWGFAVAVPTPLTTSLPTFLAIGSWDSSEAQSVDGPESARDFLQPSPTRDLDRKCLIESLSSLEEEEPEFQPIVRQIISTCSDPNVDWIQLLVESVTSKGTHVWMAERSWLIGGITKSSASWSNGFELPTEKQLIYHIDSFLELHGEYLSSDALLKIQQVRRVID